MLSLERSMTLSAGDGESGGFFSKHGDGEEFHIPGDTYMIFMEGIEGASAMESDSRKMASGACPCGSTLRPPPLRQ